MLLDLTFFSLAALILPGTPAAAPAIALRSTGRGWKLAGWAAFLMTVPMPLALLIERTVLAHQELAWRSVIKLPCALGFAFGFWLTMLQLGRLLWRRAGKWERGNRTLRRSRGNGLPLYFCEPVDGVRQRHVGQRGP